MASLMPQGKQQYFDSNGNNLSGGKVFAFAAGTSTPLDTYSDQAGTIPNTNPVVLNARGEATIFWGSASYKVVLKDASDVEIWTQDNLRASADLGDLASTSSGKGSALIGYSTAGITVKAALDERLPEIGTYALLRLYSGSYTSYYVRGVSNILDGGHGVFRVDSSDTTSADNGGTIIVDAISRRWKREYTGPVSLRWFGAKGDGVTDDTARIQAALSSGATGIYAPAGTYNISGITIPSAVRIFFGDGVATKFVGVGAPAAFTPFMNFNTLNGFELHSFSVQFNKTTYATNHAIYLGSCQRGHVHNIRIIDGGYIGIYMPACQTVSVEDVIIDSVQLHPILADTTPNGISITNVSVLAPGTGHSIAISGGVHHRIQGCLVNSPVAGSFGISLVGCAQSRVIGNTVEAVKLEGIQATDCNRVQIIGNSVYCANTTHTDMGISVFAENADAFDCLVSGNSVYNSGSTGIGLASDSRIGTKVCERNLVIGNKIYNPNRLNNANYTGVWVYGSLSTKNTVQNNEVQDTSSNVKYGTSEYDNGDGIPSFNKFVDNTVRGAGLLGEVKLLSANSEAWEVGTTSFATTVTAGSGTITTASGTIVYQRRGRMALVEANISITTNGTGAGFVTITTPFGAVEGCLVGRANAVSGKGIQAAKTGASSLAIRNYDGTYPGADGENLLISGTVRI